MPEVPADTDDKPIETITDGYFEQEYYISAADTGEFLQALGEQFADDGEITLSGGDWELPFTFGESIKLDIEFEGDGEPELEIEVELSGRVEDDTPEIV